MMKISYELLFVVVGLLAVFYFSRENFGPDSRRIPPCPGGSERGRNGMDCKSMGDRYGL